MLPGEIMKIHSVKYFIVVIHPSDHPAKNIIILRQLSRRKTFSFATFALSSSWRFLPIESFVTACDVNHNSLLVFSHLLGRWCSWWRVKCQRTTSNHHHTCAALKVKKKRSVTEQQMNRLANLTSYRVSKQVWDMLNVTFWSSEKFASEASYVYKILTQ